jgi:enoyl-CoA hydratase/carnithine racemase
MNERMTLTIADRVAHLELARPGSRNAMDPLFVTELDAALDAIDADGQVRSLLVTGQGPSFSVGGDLAYFVGRPDTHEADFGWMVDNWHACLKRLGAVPYPVVVAVHGGTAGGGLGFVYTADYVIAAENTRFAAGFADIGLSGDAGTSWYLPRLVGHRRAQAMLLDNLAIDAATALDWGLVTRVVPDDELAGVARATAERFAKRSATAFSRAKRLLLESSVNDQRQQLDAEAVAIKESAVRSDIVTGLSAFMAKQRPEFTDPY